MKLLWIHIEKALGPSLRRAGGHGTEPCSFKLWDWKGSLT